MSGLGLGSKTAKAHGLTKLEVQERLQSLGVGSPFSLGVGSPFSEKFSLPEAPRGAPAAVAAPSSAQIGSFDDAAGHDHSGDDPVNTAEIVELAAEGTGTTSSTSTTTVESTTSNVESVRSVTATGDQGIDGLLWKYCWDDGSISYCDPDESSDYTSLYPKTLSTPDGTTTTSLISQLSAQQLSTARFALDADPTGLLTTAAGFSVEGFTNLLVSYAGSGSGSGAIAIANHSTTPTATSYMPHSGVSGSGGDAFFRGAGTAPVAGNYDWHTMLHELGHTLGLKHSQETGSFGAMPSHLDSMEYSVMAYRSYIGDATAGYNNEGWSYAQTYMMYDIAALQHLYQADFTTNAGNTVYAWTPDSGDTWIDGKLAIDAGGNRIFLTTWDGGGNDTYDLSAYTTKLSVDLNPGSHSVFSTAQLADLDASSTDAARVARGNVFNALLYQGDLSSLIENATGGSGNDTITGNQADNALLGGLGGDLLTGGLGADYLCGDAGVDTVCYISAVTISLDGLLTAMGEALGNTFLGVENVKGSAGADWLRGDGAANALKGEGGKDILEGMAGNDTLGGGDGDDRLDGAAGTDRLEGGAGHDIYILAAWGDTLVEGLNAGTDTVKAGYSTTLGANLENLVLTGTSALNGNGNGLANRLTGNAAANTLSGLGGNDILLGGGGNDVLRGGAGRDTLNGGLGSDDFVFLAANDSAPSASTRDVITGGFARGYNDIVVSSIDARAGVTGNQAFVLGLNGSFSIGEIRQTVSNGNLLLEFNTDSDETAEMAMLIQGLTAKLASTDFVL